MRKIRKIANANYQSAKYITDFFDSLTNCATSRDGENSRIRFANTPISSRRTHQSEKQAHQSKCEIRYSLMNLTFFGCFVRGLLPPTFCFLNGAALRLAIVKQKRSHTNSYVKGNSSRPSQNFRKSTPPRENCTDDSSQVFPDRGQRGDTPRSWIDMRPGEDVRGSRNGVTLPVGSSVGAGGGVGRRPPLHMRIAGSHRFRSTCQWPWITDGKNPGAIDDDFKCEIIVSKVLSVES